VPAAIVKSIARLLMPVSRTALRRRTVPIMGIVRAADVIIMGVVW